MEPVAGKPAPLWKRVTDHFVFTSLFLALCAAAMVYQVYLLFPVAANCNYLGFTVCGTLCSYNFHWYLTPASYSGPGKAAWSVRHRKLHLALCAAGLAGAAFFGWHLLEHWRWLLGTAFLTFLYSAPLIPHPAARWLQRIAIGKTLFLAFAWTHVTALLPLALENSELPPAAMLYVINRFFLIYGICVLFDYRDRESDRRLGIRSVVTSFEPVGVHLFFRGVLIAFGLSCAAMPLFGYAVAATAALAAPGLVVAMVASYSLRNRGDYVFYLLLDGLMALSLPLLLLF